LKRPAAANKNKRDFPKRIGPVFRTGAFLFSAMFSSDVDTGSREENASNLEVVRQKPVSRSLNFRPMTRYCPASQDREDFMEAAIDRIMRTYDLLVNRSAAASAQARARVTITSPRRLKPAKSVCGLQPIRSLRLRGQATRAVR
jgi:hypothetical protein